MVFFLIWREPIQLINLKCNPKKVSLNWLYGVVHLLIKLQYLHSWPVHYKQKRVLIILALTSIFFKTGEKYELY